MTPPPADLPDIADPATFAARSQAWVLWQSVFYAELAAIIGITIPAGSAAAGTLTGDTLAANVINSSLAMRGGISGLTLSNNATATELDVSAGICKDSTNAASITLAAAITDGLIQTSGAWAAGSAQNKLDTGARANSTWYHVWAIRKDSDGSGDFLFSLSVSAPTMPSGYTYKRRIGSVRTDGSGNITAFSQKGDSFLWSVAAADASDVNTGVTTSALNTLTVPTGVKVSALFRGDSRNNTSVGASLLFSSPDESDQAAGAFNSSLFSQAVNVRVSAHFEVRTNVSAQIRVRPSDVNQFSSISTYGWIDTRIGD